MSRDFDPETDQFPDTGDTPSDVERPREEAPEPAPVPPDQLPVEPVREPPDETDPGPIDEPGKNEPIRIL